MWYIKRHNPNLVIVRWSYEMISTQLQPGFRIVCTYNFLAELCWKVALMDGISDITLSKYVRDMDYGCPMKPFFIVITIFGLGQTNWPDKIWGIWVFSVQISAPILVLWDTCPCFPLFNCYFYKKLGLYIHIPNIYPGLRFEFEQKRIRNLAFVCP